jgi:hypothetical protein
MICEPGCAEAGTARREGALEPAVPRPPPRCLRRRPRALAVQTDYRAGSVFRVFGLVMVPAIL